jgi:lipoprotein-releasing system permease protein
VSGSWPLSWALAWRFLRGRRSRLLGGTARAALAATALGVTAMIIAMALMTGYREDLQRKIIGGSAAVVVHPLTEEAGGEEAQARLAALPAVEAVAAVAFAQGVLSAGGGGEGVEVTLRGVGSADDRFAAGADLGGGPGGPSGVVLGSELARRLDVETGESLRLAALGFADGRPRFRYRTLRVAGTFETGFSEFDRAWAVVDRRVAEELSGLGPAGRILEVSVADLDAAGPVAAGAREALGPDYLVRDWRELNQELFTALELQQVALFFVLGLIVLVSTFNVGSTLVVLVRERMREIGVLAAMGLAPGVLRAVFLLYGAFLGAVGTLLGVAIGWGASWVLTEFELIRFDPEVAAIYFLSSVPFRVEVADVAAVAAFTLVVTLLACWGPARRAARIEPAAALRYE